jgi:exonuclease III
VVVGSAGSPRSASVAVLVRENLGISVVTHSTPVPGRLLIVDIAFQSSAFVVVCVYAPNHNPEKREFLQCLPSYLDATKDIVLRGDFNTVADAALDRSASSLHSSYDCSLTLTNLLTLSGF